MTDLDTLALHLDVHGRTLRRAASRGTIRSERRSERRTSVPAEETVYLRRHWPLLASLLGELRTLPGVTLAVLYGSLARGDGDADSDLDVLVRFGRPGLRARTTLIGRLEAATSRRVQVVELDDANAVLLADVLRDGRVLVDRSGEWSRLRRRERAIRREADRAEAELGDEVAQRLDDLFDRSGL